MTAGGPELIFALNGRYHVSTPEDQTMMKKLSAASVFRSGRTAQGWNRESADVSVSEDGPFSVRFSLKSKGGGITDVKVTIGSEDFASLLQGMIAAERGRAMLEISGALATQIAKQQDQDGATVRQARQSVVSAAEKAFVEAPPDHNHAERLLRDMVRKLVRKLNEPESGAPDTE